MSLHPTPVYRARDKARAAENRLRTTAQACRTDLRAFSGAQRDVEAGIAKNLPDVLESIRARLQEAETTVAENEAGARENDGKVLMSDKQGHHKKVLKDNIDYRALARHGCPPELKDKKKEVADVEKEISKTDSENVRGKIEDIEEERLGKTQTRAELKGRLHGLKGQIRGYEAKLNSDTYRNIEEKHRRKMIEHRTTEMAVTDLDKYWTALDKALLRFHTMKIADINKIIRELWAMTYSGEDIDMIEIVSGDDEDSGKAKR
ncbi:unnamed protein product [Ectocarpus sp. CCAP 1310/34]|nr:unnamed protein product [Ectocarpus sp. CCAP 1310/34]